MGTRFSHEQSEHDFILEQSANTYSYSKLPVEAVYKNPSQLNKYSIKGLFPDIIVQLKDGRMIIEEIETENTVNQDELEQWRAFSNLGLEFHLVVPEKQVPEAQKLASGLNKTLLQSYTIINGIVSFRDIGYL